MTNKKRYQILCEKEPSICIYNQSWWMDVVCGEENWDVLLYESGDQIIGALPYYVAKKFGLKYITTPYGSQHNGVWIKHMENQSEAKRLSLEKKVITRLIEQLEEIVHEQHICYYQQTCSPLIQSWLPFYWKGYKETSRYTYRIDDIHDPDSLFEKFQHNKRKNIKKALAADIQVKFDLSAEEFYELHKNSLAKQGQNIHYTYEYFQKIYTALYEHDAGRTIYAVDKNGTIICALFNAWDQIWGYDWISAIDPDMKSSGAPDLLVYSMLKYLSDKVQGYDFEGSMMEGVEESFRHFGAKQSPMHVINKTYTKNPLIRAAIAYKLR